MGHERNMRDVKTRRDVLMIATLAVLAAVAAGLAACGSCVAANSSPSSSAPKSGGTLRVIFPREPTGLDPAVAWEVDP